MGMAELETGGRLDAVLADYRLGDALGTEVVSNPARRGWRVPALVVTGSARGPARRSARHGLAHL
jgi:CheY-like chemotaxis protein